MDRSHQTPSREPARVRHLVELRPGDVPDWVELIPAGEFSGRDGRGPYVLDADTVQSAFAGWGMPLAIDYEHQAFNSPDNGQPAPAAGWINTLEVRNGALWGRVVWTERAAAHIAAREYRYLSPVFDHDEQGHILRLLGAGLTNTPNLYLTALNRRAEPSFNPRLENPMDAVIERIRHLFDLPATATPEEIKSPIQRLIDALAAQSTLDLQLPLGLAEKPSGVTLPDLLHAAHGRLSAEPDPTRYVPKAEYDRVTNSLATLQRTTAAERVDRAVQAAMDAHQVSPGMEAWARAYCQADFAGFEAYLQTAPVLLPGGGQATHTARPVPDTAASNPLLADAARRAGR